MEEAGRALILRDDIIALNKWHIETTGGYHDGGDNFRYPESLEWVLGVIQYPLFDPDPYPTIVEKVSLLTWTIIGGHVFKDGNKRTGMAVLETILQVNGFCMDCTQDEAYNTALEIAKGHEGNLTRDQLIEWIRAKIRARSDSNDIASPVWRPNP